MKAHGFYIPLRGGRFADLAKKKKEIEAQAFTEWQMRGLSNAEKDYIRENSYKRRVGDFILFICRNKASGRKQLYAITTEQWFYPNCHDVDACRYNCNCWLLFNSYKKTFLKQEYEVRFVECPNVLLLYVHGMGETYYYNFCSKEI